MEDPGGPEVLRHRLWLGDGDAEMMIENDRNDIEMIEINQSRQKKKCYS